MNINKKFLLIILVITGILPVSAQITISGPTCVQAGIAYTYTINGNSISPDSPRICISGGVIAGMNTNCIGTGGISSFAVNWTGGTTGNSITVSSSSDSNTLEVNVTGSIDPGQIDSSIKQQVLDTLTTPLTIICSSAIGGSCTPSYKYQWQQSEGNMIWVDMVGETNQNLIIGKPLSREMFYRRKVTETDSNTVGISDEAAIFIRYY
ncbi:MAG: hypothetical protein JST75_21560 [Bacteroidetes bacterium]|nr:hypothetical protein [Bacteroidota bacterium]